MHLWGMLGVRSFHEESGSSGTEASTAALVGRAAAGEVAAFSQLVARYHADMARVCAVICRDADAAADAVQSAWPIAWQRLATLRDPGRIRPWLISIAANQARMAARRERQRRVVELAMDAGPADGGIERRAAMADLEIALRNLSSDDRTLLALRFVADLDSAEIGRAIGLSASGVRSRLDRLIGRLRTELDDD